MSGNRNGVVPRNHNVLPPTGTRRAIVFGYQDGPLDGVLETVGGEPYQFEISSEAPNPSGLARRTYWLRHLPTGSLDRCAEIIGEFITPSWPTWLPIWRFPSEAIQLQVEERIDAILKQAGQDEREVTASDKDGLMVFVDAKPCPVCEARS